MNDGKIIIDRIMAEAETEIEAIVTQAEREANAIIQATEDKANQEKEKYRKRAEEEGRKAHAKEISGAEMQAKKALLQEKQNILDEVITEAKKRLETLPDAEYTKVIGGMLERLDDSQGKEIIVSEKDQKRLADVIAQKGFVLSQETRDIDGGFVVKNGEIEYNYSFASMIMVQKEEMQIAAAKILF